MFAQLVKTLLTGAAGVLLGFYVSKKSRGPCQKKIPEVQVTLHLEILLLVSEYY